MALKLRSIPKSAKVLVKRTKKKLNSLGLVKSILLALVFVTLASGVVFGIASSNNDSKTPTQDQAVSKVDVEEKPSEEVTTTEDPQNNETKPDSNTQTQPNGSQDGSVQPASPTTPAPRVIERHMVRPTSYKMTCSSENPCQSPVSYEIVVFAVDVKKPEHLALKSCSIWASPVGFSIPSGTVNGTTSIYTQGQGQVCKAIINLSIAGRYRIQYDIYPENAVLPDGPSMKGTTGDIYVP